MRSSCCTILCGTLRARSASALAIENSENCIIVENLISNNSRGIDVKECNGLIYHNSFVNNTEQVLLAESNDIIWDDGYPSGGNYWSNNAFFVDEYQGPNQNVLASDGIGDAPFVIDANNTDKYPLMGPFTDFDVSWTEKIYHFNTICNSTISNFQWTHEDRKTRLDLTGEDGTAGFCRIMIPRSLIEGPYVVIVDRHLINSIELPISNSTHAFLYFKYIHSTHEVTIVPKLLYFDDVLDKYTKLLANYTKLLANLESLNSTYHKLWQDYGLLLGNYSQLVKSYSGYLELQENYTSLQNRFDNLQNSYESLLFNFNNLQLSCNQLNSFYNALKDSYDELQSSQEATLDELGYIRNLTYIFLAAIAVLIATAVVLTATTVYFAKRKPKTKT